MTQTTEARPVSTLRIVGVFAVVLVILTALLNIIIMLIPFDNPAMGLIMVFAAGGSAASTWVASEKAIPASGRAWKVAVICGLLAAVLSAGLATAGLSGDEHLWREFTRSGLPTLAALFCGIAVVEVLFVRLGFWLTFRQAARKLAR